MNSYSDTASCNAQAVQQLYPTQDRDRVPPYLTACPVVYEQARPPSCKDLEYSVLKELHRLAQDADVTSEQLITYLQTLSSAYILTPADWKNMMRMVLMMTQYLVWFSDYHSSCLSQTGRLQRRDPRVLGVQLTGEDVFENARAQTDYPRDVYDLIAHLSIAVLRQVPMTDKAANISYTKVEQGPSEPYTVFMDRLQAALA